ncbi:MAG: hypothetical protein KatS3mg015_2379 [Fimbriimonadales bacterium]|nr:MAG: hypothetical protein KatS3mg015_2379 [Fimbriimonadales bacterium]
MADVVCDTTALQYLHQLGLLHLLPALADRVIIPPAVVDELEVGRAHGYDVPDPVTLDWLEIRRPSGTATLPSTPHLGAAEREVMALALEQPGLITVLDDGLARETAQRLHLPLTGTLGLLIDAKGAGLVQQVAPLLDRLQALGFRLSARTRVAVLRLAGEEA